MGKENNKPDEKVTTEPETPKFENLGELFNYFQNEMSEIKKLIKPDKKERVSKDDFKLYHEQTESRLDALNSKMDSFENQAKSFFEKFQGHGGNTSLFNNVWDFLFKL